VNGAAQGLTQILAIPLAAVAAGLVCAFARPIGEWLGVLDAPDGRRKIHPKVTPLVGGLAVLLPVVAVALWQALATRYTPFYLTFAATTAACFVLGLWDDRRHIRPIYRLVLSVAIALAMMFAVPALQVSFFNFSFISDALFLYGLTPVFTLLCLVGLQNAVNMADGKNGIVLGLSLFWTVDLALFAPDHLMVVLMVMAAALAVTLVFNLRGRLFLGDSGTYALSVVMAMLAIYVHSVGFVRLPADLIALWFLIPVVDCLRLMAKRMLGGRSPFTSDRDHLHHMLYARMPWRWGLMVYLGLVGVPGLLAGFWPETTLVWAAGSLICYTVIVIWPRAERRSADMQVL
jgi:UDP-GlcNAc:undecaprenyl-phosphate GlcNAc-1-phosphate transferase